MLSLQQRGALRRAPFGPIGPRSTSKLLKCHVVAALGKHQLAATGTSSCSSNSSSTQQLPRRLLLLMAGLAAPAPAVLANPLEDVARQLTRPSDITPLDAAVALLDARSTLREMQPLVASAADSKERFQGRKLWPAYAKWLRPVGPSAPVAAAVIAGTDAEATLSVEYGGTGGSASPVDAVYVALGRVLTISGRTIKDEAQVSVELIKDAEVAISNVLEKLPKALLDDAQQFRVARAAGGKA